MQVNTGCFIHFLISQYYVHLIILTILWVNTHFVQVILW